MVQNQLLVASGLRPDAAGHDADRRGFREFLRRRLLADLHLGNNELTGGVPAFLGDLPNLERLSLGGNELGGGIPATLGSLGNLWELELRNSGLTGPVPTELGSLANLTHLFLDGNELMGPVPAEFGNLTDLAYLYLNGNAELTGPLPLSLTRLSRLAVLDVSASALCAPADAAFQSWLATVDFRGDTCAVPNRPPQPVGTIPAQTLREGGVATVDVASAFGDPDGDMLTYRAASSAPHVVTARAAGARVTLTAVSEGTATIRVTATDPGGLSGGQAFTVTVTAMRVPFTDDPIVLGVTPIRAIHFTELRTRIDALRSVVGLARFSWTDPVLRAEVTRVRRVHVLELRQALAEAYQASARTTPRWTDPSPGAGTPIRALHVTELRAAVLALE